MTAGGSTVQALWAAVEGFDEDAFDQALAGALWDRPLEQAVSEVVLPFLAELGDRWEQGELTVAHEHFASNLVRHRLGALAVGVRRDPAAPVAVLACPAGERHDLVLLCFSLLLSRLGWRTHFLGGDTPSAALGVASRTADADAVVVAATRSLTFEAHAVSLGRLGAERPLFLAGRGATPAVAQLLGARLLPEDPVVAAREVADTITRRAPPSPEISPAAGQESGTGAGGRTPPSRVPRAPFQPAARPSSTSS